ncbi:hypothetical protein [Thiomicrorhabdus xiamenensis]|uniref:Bacteriophage CI repressor helix-turn-helix domain-containing protein n=1 Tax=Thiomicrorhabdus xiamenensis TaxID=2739063 RepID=A0A7D4P5Q3_9GAMM|nr:hypothetical protein [Thiomicrorhabdus xiamenensis]QKI90056.1 hypothetical protein HQN79_10950 [Thiomicrorhabdus xiamenensis]
MRNQIDKNALINICDRFLDVSENYLGLSMKRLADELGYKNQSTLTKVRNRKGFIGPDKLQLFGSLTNNKGEHPNIHFIITGEEPVLIKGEKEIERSEMVSKEGDEINLLSKRLVEKVGSQKAKELLSIILT